MRSPSRAFLIGASLLGIVLLIREPLRAATLCVLRFPFTAVKTSIKVFMTLPRLPALSQENERLRSSLIQEQLALGQVREELRHAQQAQALKEAFPSAQGIIASVIARSIVPAQHTVMLDQGSRQGLSLDTALVDAFGVIGRLVEVHRDTSLVMLLTDEESRVAGLIERSRETGLLVGRGRGVCELIYLDEAADVQEGDRVMTAGLWGSFPKGFALGIVTRVVRDAQAGSTRALVKPAAHLGQLEEVLCLTPKAR